MCDLALPPILRFGQPPGRQPFQTPEQVHQLTGVLSCEGGDPAAGTASVPAVVLYEPLLLEPLESRADRGAAHSEPVGDFRLDDRTPGSDLSVYDQTADTIVGGIDTTGLRRTCSVPGVPIGSCHRGAGWSEGGDRRPSRSGWNGRHAQIGAALRHQFPVPRFDLPTGGSLRVPTDEIAPESGGRRR